MGEKERGIRDNCIKANELWFQIKMIRVLFYKFWILCLRFLIPETIRRKRYSPRNYLFYKLSQECL